MAIGSGLGRYDVLPHVAVGAHELHDEELDAMGSVDVLGTRPVVLVQWPEIVDLPRRRSVLPALALIGSAAVVLAAGLIVLANRPSRSTHAVEPPALTAAAAQTDRVRAARPTRPSEPYGAAIRGHERELHRCVQFHGETFPIDAEAVIVVGVDGRARQVALRPDSAEHSPLGSCIRGVLQDVTFPATRSDMEVAVSLAVYR